MSMKSLVSVSVRGALLSVAGAALCVSASACSSGPAPGDYVVYQIAFTAEQKSASCYPDKKVPKAEKSDSTDILSSTKMFVYGAALEEDAYYLQGVPGPGGDAVTLEGTLESDHYSFSGMNKDIEYNDIGTDELKVTTTDTVDVEADIDGKSISGSWTWVNKVTCTGNNKGCSDIIKSCTHSSSFVGTEVEVELQHEI